MAQRTYGKRPLWHWLLFYLIVGVTLYFVLYLLFFQSGGTSSDVYQY